MGLYERIVNGDKNAIDEILAKGETVIHTLGDVLKDETSYVLTDKRLISISHIISEEEIGLKQKTMNVGGWDIGDMIEEYYVICLSVPYKNISQCKTIEKIPRNTEAEKSNQKTSQKVSSEFLIYEIGKDEAALTIKGNSEIDVQEFQRTLMQYIL